MTELFVLISFVIDHIGDVLELIGGSAIVSSIFPKLSKLKTTKSSGFVAKLKEITNLVIVVYNSLLKIANLIGFNFNEAKNEKDSANDNKAV